MLYLPVLYEGAVESSAPAIEHVAFFSAGIVLWLPVLETSLRPSGSGTGAKLAHRRRQLVATVVGNVFIWGGSAFYDVPRRATTSSASPDADQSLAGSLMMLEGSLVTIVALAWLFLRMAQEGGAPGAPRRRESTNALRDEQCATAAGASSRMPPYGVRIAFV